MQHMSIHRCVKRSQELATRLLRIFLSQSLLCLVSKLWHKLRQVEIIRELISYAHCHQFCDICIRDVGQRWRGLLFFGSEVVTHFRSWDSSAFACLRKDLVLLHFSLKMFFNFEHGGNDEDIGSDTYKWRHLSILLFALCEKWQIKKYWHKEL